MCTASSTLLYGITVKAMDFALVAAAYKRSRPALLAIDLILQRRAHGRLEVEDSVVSDVCALPAEVWDLVKRELLDKAFDRERKRFASRHREQHCACCECCCDNKPGDRCADVFECDLAYQTLMEGDGVTGFVKPYEKKVAGLLADYGLGLASNNLISVEESYWTDLDSAWGIALPLATDEQNGFPVVNTTLRHEYGTTHALSAVSPSTFILPADADARFRRLLSAFPILEPISLTTDTIRPRTEQGTAREHVGKDGEREKEQMSDVQRREHEREAAARTRRAASEPRWILWTEGDSCV